MTKDGLLSQFENCKNNYILGLAATALFADERTYPILAESHCQLGTYTITFDQVVGLLAKPEDRQIAVKEFTNMLLRSLTVDAVELVVDYCESTKQDRALARQPWYLFARLIRGCIGNASRFKFRNYDRRALPVVWRGKEISEAMDGTYLQLSFWGHTEAWGLYQEIVAFVGRLD